VNFWAALIFASLYQDKEDGKKVNTNEGEAYKDSVPEISNTYNDRPGETLWQPTRNSLVKRFKIRTFPKTA
jgi:hypothetical protein